MIRSYLVTCCTVALVCAPTSGQTQRNVWFPDSNAAAGGANTFPWSAPGIRYQCIFTAAQMGNKPCLVNDVWAAPQLSMLPKIRTAFYDDIEIRMGMTSAATVTGSWSSNNPNPTTVYRGPLRVTFEVSKWRGLGLPKPFVYLPLPSIPNLCFEVIIWKANLSNVTGIRALVGTGTRRAFRNTWTSNQSIAPLTGASAAK
ncbi:MAG: hypothetical protein ACYST0_14660, partial [Planctomycetota bacterium]